MTRLEKYIDKIREYDYQFGVNDCGEMFQCDCMIKCEPDCIFFKQKEDSFCLGETFEWLAQEVED